MSRICFILFAVIFIFGCKPSKPQTEVENEMNSLIESLHEVTESPLHSSISDTIFTRRNDSLLQIAGEDFFADSMDLANIIWYGRRLAANFQFTSAAKIYTYGLSVHPDSPELYRHLAELAIIGRRPSLAIEYLNKGIKLAESRDLEGEPDVIPNKLNIPLSNLHFNLHFLHGFAHYLQSNYKEANNSWIRAHAYANNPDLVVKTIYWQYIAQHHFSSQDALDSLLNPVHESMEIIEYPEYLQQCLLFQGKSIPDPEISSPERFYGMTFWYHRNHDELRKDQIISAILNSKARTSPGYLALEADQKNNSSK